MMQRILCLLIGYAFGLFQTAYIYGRLKGVDIRNYGSGNLGMTNAMRVLGKKAGLIVFLGDLIKAFAACAICAALFGEGPGLRAGSGTLWMLYAGLGVELGHNFPFYLKFKGGKGISSLGGLIIMLDWRITLILLVLFLAVLLTTNHMSVASMTIAAGFLILWLVFGFCGLLPLRRHLLIESCVLVAVIAVMAFVKHRSNIERLRTGTENEFLNRKKE